MRYEELFADPRAALTPLAQWLAAEGRVPLEFDDEAMSAAAAAVSGELARHGGEGELPGVLRGSVATLTSFTGAHDRLPESAPEEPPSWMADVIEQRRDYEDLYARYMRYVKWRRRIPFLGSRGRPATDDAGAR